MCQASNTTLLLLPFSAPDTAFACASKALRIAYASVDSADAAIVALANKASFASTTAMARSERGSGACDPRKRAASTETSCTHELELTQSGTLRLASWSVEDENENEGHAIPRPDSTNRVAASTRLANMALVPPWLCIVVGRTMPALLLPRSIEASHVAQNANCASSFLSVHIAHGNESTTIKYTTGSMAAERRSVAKFASSLLGP